MYVYCVYPAMLKSPKQLPTCLIDRLYSNTSVFSNPIKFVTASPGNG